jgi:hypothetical protein
MNSAVEYIKKLEEAVKVLQFESDAFRQSYTHRGLSLPQGVSSTRFQLNFEAASVMDESDSDNDERDARRQDDDDSVSPRSMAISSSRPIPAPVSQSPAHNSIANMMSSSFGTPPEPFVGEPFASGSPGTSTPIPIPGTVGAPIRPHETRTRLERVTGSSQHLVNKNPRKKSPTRERFMDKGTPASPNAMQDQEREANSMEEEPLGRKNQSSDDMMEAMDFMNDIEEVGAWPLYSNQQSQGPAAHSAGHSFQMGKLNGNDSPVMLGKFDSPMSNAAKSVGTFSPKLVFVDSPTNLLAGASYAAYVNPFDSNY